MVGLLITLSGSQEGRSVKLGDGVLRIGRKADNDFAFDEDTVSGYHAEIRPEGNRYILVDKQSLNGTFVNGRRITDTAVLRQGDVIQVGRRGPKVRFHSDGPTPTDATRREESADSTMAVGGETGSNLNLAALAAKLERAARGKQVGEQTMMLYQSVARVHKRATTRTVLLASGLVLAAGLAVLNYSLGRQRRVAELAAEAQRNQEEVNRRAFEGELTRRMEESRKLHEEDLAIRLQTANDTFEIELKRRLEEEQAAYAAELRRTTGARDAQIAKTVEERLAARAAAERQAHEAELARKVSEERQAYAEELRRKMDEERTAYQAGIAQQGARTEPVQVASREAPLQADGAAAAPTEAESLTEPESTAAGEAKLTKEDEKRAREQAKLAADDEAEARRQAESDRKAADKREREAAKQAAEEAKKLAEIERKAARTLEKEQKQDARALAQATPAEDLAQEADTPAPGAAQATLASPSLATSSRQSAVVLRGPEGKNVKVVKPKDVIGITVLVDGEARRTALIPGKELSLDIIVKNKKGESYSTREKTLGFKELRVAAGLLRVAPTLTSLTPEGDHARVGKDAYSLLVQYGSGKDLKEARLSFAADFAALHGPEPQEITALEFSVGSDERFLVPGKAAPLVVVVTDKSGRQYRSDATVVRVPWDRLEVTTSLATWDARSGVVTGEADVARIGGKPYTVSVEYKGRSDLKRSKSFIADFASINGPDAQDVSSLVVNVDGVSEGGIIVPGSSHKLSVGVMDRYDRTFRLGDKLPADRLEVSFANFEFDAATSTIRAFPDCKKMVGKDYGITVEYKGRSDLRKAVRYAPDFLGAVAGYLYDGKQLGASGARGEQGEAGMAGQSGAAGRSASDTYGTGGDGGAGGDGRPGRPGRKGGRGPRIKLSALEVYTADRAERLVLIESVVGSDKPVYLLRKYDSPGLSVIASGGQGGAGGPAGGGGNGGQGGMAYNTGSGGAGGRGGQGGPGGEGGQGGDVILIASAQEIASNFDLQAPGGPGGPGGAAGQAGAAGKAGSPVAALATAAAGLIAAFGGGTVQQPPTAQFGSLGPRGEVGYEGDPGREGAAGTTETQVLPDAGGLASRLPPELAACLVLP